jgi:hypothetical protein
VGSKFKVQTQLADLAKATIPIHTSQPFFLLLFSRLILSKQRILLISILFLSLQKLLKINKLNFLFKISQNQLLALQCPEGSRNFFGLFDNN